MSYEYHPTQAAAEAAVAAHRVAGRTAYWIKQRGGRYEVRSW